MRASFNIAGQGIRQATTEEYADWVEAFFAAGGKVKFASSSDMKDMLIATRDVTVPELRGANAISMIIPADVKLCAGTGCITGHNEFFFMNGGRAGLSLDHINVNLWRDTIAELKKRGHALDELTDRVTECAPGTKERCIADIKGIYSAAPPPVEVTTGTVAGPMPASVANLKRKISRAAGARAHA
jgi:hypothetical protein